MTVDKLRDEGTVDARDDLAVGREALGELAEGLEDVVEVAIEVEMIGVDVRDDDAVGRKIKKRAVALVGLGNDPLALAGAGISAEVRDLAADQSSWVESGFNQRERAHRGCRRFACACR